MNRCMKEGCPNEGTRAVDVTVPNVGSTGLGVGTRTHVQVRGWACREHEQEVREGIRDLGTRSALHVEAR